MRSFILAIVAGLALFCSSSDVSAARNNSSNVIYFNASGSPVGQQAYFCNGVRWQGGEQTSPYQLVITGSCKGLIINCNANGDDVNCGTTIATSVSYDIHGNPPFNSEEACDLAGRSPCETIEPQILSGYGFTVTRTR